MTTERRSPTTPSADAQSSSGALTGYEAELWRMADALRGSMDAADYKHVVLGLIFLKYISDAFQELHAWLESKTVEGYDPEDMDEYRGENIFWVPPEARWSHLKAQARQPTIGQLVDDAMAAVERDNPALKGVLPKLSPWSSTALLFYKSHWVIYHGHVFHACLVDDLDRDFHSLLRQVERCCRRREHLLPLLWVYLSVECSAEVSQGPLVAFYLLDVDEPCAEGLRVVFGVHHEAHDLAHAGLFHDAKRRVEGIQPCNF